MLHKLLHQRRTGKRRLGREQEIERAAEAVNVGPDVGEHGVLSLLRRDVIGGADQSSLFFIAPGTPMRRRDRAAVCRLHASGQTPVDNLDDRIGCSTSLRADG